MRTDKAAAIKLRLRGYSYGEIQKALGGISKSTLSLWLNNLTLSADAFQRIKERTREKSFKGLLKRNKNQTFLARQRMRDNRREAQEEIKKITNNDLLFIGIALYWAEGHKRPMFKDGRELTCHSVSMTNSDPILIKIFIEFLKRCCGVKMENIKANVRIFKHLNEKEVINYWERETGISKDNFTKTYLGISKSSMGKRPFNRLPYGVLQVRMGNTNLFHRIMGWIEAIKDFDNLMPR